MRLVEQTLDKIGAGAQDLGELVALGLRVVGDAVTGSGATDANPVARPAGVRAVADQAEGADHLDGAGVYGFADETVDEGGGDAHDRAPNSAMR